MKRHFHGVNGSGSIHGFGTKKDARVYMAGAHGRVPGRVCLGYVITKGAAVLIKKSLWLLWIRIPVYLRVLEFVDDLLGSTLCLVHCIASRTFHVAIWLCLHASCWGRPTTAAGIP